MEQWIAERCRDLSGSPGDREHAGRVEAAIMLSLNVVADVMLRASGHMRLPDAVVMQVRM